MTKFSVTSSPAERLFARSTPTADGCLNFSSAKPGGTHANVFYLNGKYVTAYRAAWLIHKGPIPDGQIVCHTCDNGLCVNPDHLWLGSQADNMADMIAKGRRANFKGERHGMSKLTKDDAAAIRAAYIPRKVTLRTLASRYNVAVGTVHRIILGTGWKPN